MSQPDQELSSALKSQEYLRQWMATRGFVPVSTPPPVPQTRMLAGATYYHAPDHPQAPRLLVLWRDDMRERSIHGKELRSLQREANHYRDLSRAKGYRAEAPHLCLVGCPDFLMAFPLDGDPYARRLRFSPERLRNVESPLYAHFRALDASSMETWVLGTGQESSGDDEHDALFDDLLGDDDEVRYDFKRLFVGGELDDEFVAFMDLQRRRIASQVLDPAHRKILLEPMWRKLRSGPGNESLGEDLPPLAELVRQRRFRNGLIAAVDTVLLRLVLYRYLEAQFAYTIPESEQRQIALGTSYDQLLDQAARVDQKKLTNILKKARKGFRARRSAAQLELFTQPAPVEVVDPEGFSAGLRDRAEFYQASAGGDLHQGNVAEAADVLQEFLRQQRREEFALLLAGTSTEQYSFHYADLDPRAFQRFYEQTIGTDIRVTYDAASSKVQVGVVDHKRNRKEQGAFFTDERICTWLVERTLGVRFKGWLDELLEILQARGRKSGGSAGRIPAVRGKLDELLSWRILDPTCGGGIFLRTAFEFLSRKHRSIADVLQGHLPDKDYREIIRTPPHDVFAMRTPRDPAGSSETRWEWHILLHMLYGVDIDVKAINVASNLLTLSALSYKPSGICFPSFINTNLKRGNALINPLPYEERAAFLAESRRQIRKLLELRSDMRDPSLDRDRWRKLQAETATITRSLVHGRIVRSYSHLYPDLDPEQLVRRVLQVGVFLYEAEFPEAFFQHTEKGVRLRSDPGFDIILGNPPWEEPAAEYKHFLPEFDPTYRELSQKESKKREKQLLTDPEIARRWEEFQTSVEDYKDLLTASGYEHQKAEVLGKTPGAHSNLYKYATEMVWHLLVPESGHAGVVMDGGLWSDLAAKGLRQLLLEHARDTKVCGFNNKNGLFPAVDPRQRFGCVTFRKDGSTDTLRAVFMQDDFDALERFEHIAASIPIDDIRSDPRDSYPVPEVRSQEHYDARHALENHPSLRDAPWHVDTYSRELNAGEQRHFFHKRAKAGYLPLIQGTQFNQFGVHQGELPDAWVDPSDRGAGGFLRGKQESRILLAIANQLAERGQILSGGKKKSALRWIASVLGKTAVDDVPQDWIRLDWDGYRLAWRDIARNDDRRSLIAAIVPPDVALSDTAPFVRPFSLRVREQGIEWLDQYPSEQLLYLAGILSSFACDSAVRSRLAKTHLTSDLFKGLPVPPWTGSAEQRRVAELTARLTCLPATPERPWADYRALAAAVGLTPERHGLVDPAARRDAEVELNAILARLYGLDRRSFRFWMDTLFMTPKYKAVHGALRDDVLARM